MHWIIKSISTVIISGLLLAACAENVAPTNDPYNDADSQRNHAGKTQGELSRETAK